MIPDAEKVIGDHLRDETGERIVGTPPRDPNSEAWVRLTQLDARAVGGHRSDHLIEYLIQLDCYASQAGVSGSQQREAATLARTIRAALIDMPNFTLDAVVTGVDIRGDARIPDDEFEPARERFIITASVWMHP